MEFYIYYDYDKRLIVPCRNHNIIEVILMLKYKVSIGALAAVAVLLSILIAAKPEPLPEYHEEESTEITVEPEISLFTYLTDSYEIDVPSGWKEAVKEGTTMFIDPETASVIEVSQEPYYPQINAIDENAAASNLSAGGYAISEFHRISGSAYRCAYVKDNIAYLEYVYWDFDNVYTVLGKYSPDYYSKVFDKLTASLESFQHYGTQIPDSWSVLYYEYGNFAIMANNSWRYYESSDTITLEDPVTGLIIDVSVYISSGDFSDLDQLSFTDEAASGKYNYIQSAYTNTGKELYAFATYTANGGNYGEYHFGVASGEYIYLVKVTLPAEQDTTDMQIFVDNFKYY